METTKTTNPAVARKLLREGNLIIDIKANKADKDRTVFIFELTEKFEQDFVKVTAKPAAPAGAIGAFDPEFFKAIDGNMSEM